MKIAVIGGGAAGFFAAINAKTNYPASDVIILEKTQKILSKVKISGGGRCNVTNGSTSISKLASAYPRGGKLMKKALHTFSTQNIIEWFESRGVPLKIEKDGRVFPVSDKSQSIVDCLLSHTKLLGIPIRLGSHITSIEPVRKGIKLHTKKERETFDKVIVSTGGSPKKSGLLWLESLGHRIVEPIPSLFSFNMPDEPIKELMGLSVGNVLVSIQTSKLNCEGPLLITHWGMSGPAILRLSSFGARILSDLSYQFKVSVNWVNTINEDVVKNELLSVQSRHSKKNIKNVKAYDLPERLWHYLLERSGLESSKKWGEMSKKSIYKLISILCNDHYKVQGKTTFKEEFVTCGGVSLDSIDVNSMKSKQVPNLYFAGEILDIDAITGGYNFQAAWTTAFIAARLE